MIIILFTMFGVFYVTDSCRDSLKLKANPLQYLNHLKQLTFTTYASILLDCYILIHDITTGHHPFPKVFPLTFHHGQKDKEDKNWEISIHFTKL